MNKAIKIGKVMTQLKHLEGDIIFLQETNLKTSDIQRIKKPWMSHVFHSKFSSKARGAAIIITKNILFKPAHITEDVSGRYVIVSGLLQNLSVVLVSIYAPNWDDDQSNSAKVVFNCSSHLGILDPWRFKNPPDSCYHPIVVSDHAPTSLDINLPLSVISSPLWKFSSHLLAHHEFENFVATVMDFFSLNLTTLQ